MTFGSFCGKFMVVAAGIVFLTSTAPAQTGFSNQSRNPGFRATSPKRPAYAAGTSRQCDRPNYRHSNGIQNAGYHIPVYPGPDASLPQGGYYSPYHHGYNGYYNNGYYNNGYYSNGGSTTSTSGFPQFERY